MILLGALIGVACMGGGAATAYFVLGPRIFQPSVEQVVVAQDSNGLHMDAELVHQNPGRNAGRGGGAAHEVALGSSLSHRIDGFIVNPANTRGTRYLLMSLEIKVPSEADIRQIEAHETALRHAVIRLLGSKTVGFLADVSNWDVLANDLKEVVEATVPNVSVHGVMFPEYVIQ